MFASTRIISPIFPEDTKLNSDTVLKLPRTKLSSAYWLLAGLSIKITTCENKH